jgi:zinc protease
LASFVAAISSTSFAAPPTQSAFVDFGDVARATLPNGTHAWVQEDHRAPLVAVESCFEIGDVDDPVERRGLAQLAGRLLELGQTPHLDESARRDMSVALGGLLAVPKVNVGTKRTCLHLVVPSSSLELALFAERDRMVFVAEGLTAPLLGQALSALAEATPNATAAAVVLGRLREGIYEAGHPLTRLTPTDGAALGDLGIEGVRRALRTWFGGGPSDVAIVGDVSAARAFELLTKGFGDLAGPFVRPPLAAPGVALTAERHVAVDANVVRTEIALGWPTPKYADDDDLALDVAVRVLALRFGDHLKDRDRLVTHFRLNENSLPEGSVFSIDLTPASDLSEERCVRAVDAELAALSAAAPSNEEVGAAKQMILENLANALDGDGTRATAIVSYVHSTGDPRGYVKYAERYQAISASDVSRAVARYLSGPRRVLLVVHPDAKAPKVGRLHDDRGGRAGHGAPPTVGPTQVTPPVAALAPPFLDSGTRVFAPPRPIDLVRRDGTRVELIERHTLPSVSVGISIRWKKPSSGLSVNGFMNTVLLAAKGAGSEDSLEDVLRKAGAAFSSQSSLDGATFTFSVHPDQLAGVLPRALAILEAPRISQAAFDLARAPFDGQAAHWRPVVRDAMWSRHLLAPAGHRYAGAVDSGEAELRRLTLAQLSSYLADELRHQALGVDVVGDVTTARLAQILGARRTAPRAVAAEAPAAWDRGTFLVPQSGAKGVTVIATFAEPPIGSADAVAAHALEALAFTFFNDALLTHGVDTWSDFSWSHWQLRDGPLFNLYIRVDKGRVTAFVKAVLDAVDALRHQSVAAGIARVRSSETFETAKAYDSSREASRRLVSLTEAGLPSDADLRLGEHLNDLSPRQLVDVANRYFRPTDLRVVVVGDVDGLEDGLSTLPIAPAKIVSEPAPGLHP